MSNEQFMLPGSVSLSNSKKRFAFFCELIALIQVHVLLDRQFQHLFLFVVQSKRYKYPAVDVQNSN